jgi:hypothetical protein
MINEKIMELAQIEKDGVRVGVNMEIEVRETEETETGKYRPLNIIILGTTHYLSDRARKNLLKLTGFSNRLLLDLPTDQLRKDLNHQIHLYESLGISHIDTQVITIFDCTKRSFLSYENMLSLVKDKILFMKGNPVKDDFIQVQFNAFDTDDKILGLNILLSSTGNIKNTFNLSIVDRVENTYWVNKYLKSGSEDFLDKEMLLSLATSFEKGKDGLKFNVGLFLQAMESFKIENLNHLARLLSSFSGGKKIKKAILDMCELPKENEVLLKKAGISEIATLLDAFKFFVFVSSNSPNAKTAVTLSIKTVDWAKNVVNTLAA